MDEEKPVATGSDISFDGTKVNATYNITSESVGGNMYNILMGICNSCGKKNHVFTIFGKKDDDTICRCPKEYYNDDAEDIIMNLYEITNGFCGESYVKCMVIAETPEKAIELSCPKFKEDATLSGKALYSFEYWTRLKAELIFSDVSNEHVGEVRDY